MKKAILAKKIGMTQIFNEDGSATVVTVLEAGPCTVLSKKIPEKDGYSAIQVGFKTVKEKRLNKPQRGHFAKTGLAPLRFVREFRISDIDSYQVGENIKAGIFKSGEYVDVAAISKGKGFAGSIKRHGQKRGAMSHGSRYHRGPGSLGAVGPSRVFKGQALPGRMGGKRVTVQKLEVVKVDEAKNLLIVKGAVPGPSGGLVAVNDSVKVG